MKQSVPYPKLIPWFLCLYGWELSSVFKRHLRSFHNFLFPFQSVKGFFFSFKRAGHGLETACISCYERLTKFLQLSHQAVAQISNFHCLIIELKHQFKLLNKKCSDFVVCHYFVNFPSIYVDLSPTEINVMI